MDAATLRADFPEFADATAYPDASVNFWLSYGVKLLNPDRWTDCLDLGLELFTCHNLSLERRAAQEAQRGKAPGATTGPTASMTVKDVSISYDVASGIEKDAGHWNLTTYGTRFIHMARLMGAGALYVA